jgi:hypothetical protein
MNRVYPAEPYGESRLGTFGNASYMFLAQFDFPDQYEGHEPMLVRYSDRLQKADTMNTCVVLQRHGCGFTDFNSISDSGFEFWVRRQTAKSLLAFLIDLLKADRSAKWTGCRVTASTGGNGHTVYSFELFARDPGGQTAVWTGEPAPNVLAGRRHS